MYSNDTESLGNWQGAFDRLIVKGEDLQLGDCVFKSRQLILDEIKSNLAITKKEIKEAKLDTKKYRKKLLGNQ